MSAAAACISSLTLPALPRREAAKAASLPFSMLVIEYHMASLHFPIKISYLVFMQLNAAELTIKRAETGHISSTILSPLAFRVLPLSTISTIASAIPKIGQAQRCLLF
jgi:hypothetical protein